MVVVKAWADKATAAEVADGNKSEPCRGGGGKINKIKARCRYRTGQQLDKRRELRCSEPVVIPEVCAVSRKANLTGTGCSQWASLARGERGGATFGDKGLAGRGEREGATFGDMSLAARSEREGGTFSYMNSAARSEREGGTLGDKGLAAWDEREVGAFDRGISVSVTCFGYYFVTFFIKTPYFFSLSLLFISLVMFLFFPLWGLLTGVHSS